MKEKTVDQITKWIISLAFIALGIYAIFVPEGLIAFLSVIIGIVLVLSGAAIAYNGFSKRSDIFFPYARMFWGILLCLIGLIFLLNHSFPNYIIAIIFGIVALISAVFRFGTAYQFRKQGQKCTWLFLSSAINFIFAVLIILFPIISVNIFVQILGVYWVYLGICIFIESFKNNQQIMFF